jgi:D-arginine dehydrogenase
MKHFAYVIVGAGFAGAATAYQLARQGVADVLVLEQESIPGFHASGRNAAMLRQCVAEPDLTKLALDGAAFIRNLPADWPEPVLFKNNGSLLLGSGAGWDKLKRDGDVGRSVGITGIAEWSPAEAVRHVPLLAGAEFDGALWCASDGVVDIHALLSGYLKFAVSRGATVRYNAALSAVNAKPGADIELNTAEGVVSCKVLINSSGAWANVVAQMSGARQLPMRACRRHLFVSPPLPWVDRSWPFVWDVSHDIYFRPEGEGLLLCACDQTELAPGDPPLDESVKVMLAEKIQRYMPGLSEVSISRGWAGLRTLTPDGRFIIGWDPKIEGLFWVAGLGGHGMTTSAAVGELAAQLLIGGPGSKSAPFAPERFDAV